MTKGEADRNREWLKKAIMIVFKIYKIWGDLYQVRWLAKKNWLFSAIYELMSDIEYVSQSEREICIRMSFTNYCYLWKKKNLRDEMLSLYDYFNFQAYF